MSMKNSNDNIGNRTRDLTACSAMPKPTALLRAPLLWIMSDDILYLLVVSPNVKTELVTTSEKQHSLPSTKCNNPQRLLMAVWNSVGLFIVLTYNARFEFLTAVVSRCATNKMFCHCTLRSNSLQNVVEWLWGNYCTVKAILYTGEYKNLSLYTIYDIYRPVWVKFRCKRSE